MTLHVTTAYFSILILFKKHRKICQCTFNCYDKGHDLVPFNHPFEYKASHQAFLE